MRAGGEVELHRVVAVEVAHALARVVVDDQVEGRRVALGSGPHPEARGVGGAVVSIGVRSRAAGARSVDPRRLQAAAKVGGAHRPGQVGEVAGRPGEPLLHERHLRVAELPRLHQGDDGRAVGLLFARERDGVDHAARLPDHLAEGVVRAFVHVEEARHRPLVLLHDDRIVDDDGRAVGGQGGHRDVVELRVGHVGHRPPRGVHASPEGQLGVGAGRRGGQQQQGGTEGTAAHRVLQREGG